MKSNTEYRIIYKYPYYCVQESTKLGWGIFKKTFWFEIDFFYNLKEAEEMYSTLTNKIIQQ